MTQDAGALLKLAEYHEANCCRYTNGVCMTLRCQRRGGYVPGTIPDYANATCEEHETAVIIRQAASQGSAGGEAESLMREMSELLDSCSPTEDVGVYDNHAQWIHLATVKEIRAAALSPPVKTGGEVETHTDVAQHNTDRAPAADEATGDAGSNPVVGARPVDAGAREEIAQIIARHMGETMDPHECADAILALPKLTAAGGERSAVQGEEPYAWTVERLGDKTFPRIFKLHADAAALVNYCNVGPLPTMRPLYLGVAQAPIDCDEAMVRLSASESACYRWPEDTAEHRAMRAAFMDGAASMRRQEP